MAVSVSRRAALGLMMGVVGVELAAACGQRPSTQSEQRGASGPQVLRTPVPGNPNAAPRSVTPTLQGDPIPPGMPDPWRINYQTEHGINVMANPGDGTRREGFFAQHGLLLVELPPSILDRYSVIDHPIVLDEVTTVSMLVAKLREPQPTAEFTLLNPRIGTAESKTPLYILNRFRISPGGVAFRLPYIGRKFDSPSHRYR
jgi:hypothetical protein